MAKNLFTAAASAKSEPKKTRKGTTIELPRELDENGQLVGESARMHQAIADFLEAEEERKSATNRGNAAKLVLSEYVLDQYCQMFAAGGIPPATPINVVNYRGESLTYVVQDRSGQYSLDEGQLAILEASLGPDTVTMMTHEKATFSFSPEIMAQPAAGTDAEQGETVQDVVAAIVSAAISRSSKLSQEQKDAVIAAKGGTYLKPTAFDRLAEFCGQSSGTIKTVIKGLGSVITRYFR